VIKYYDAGGITIYHGDCRALALPERPALVLADPPYGTNGKADQRSESRGKRRGLGGGIAYSALEQLPVAGDDEPFDPSHLLALKTKTILWGANYYADKLPPSRCWLTWDKRDGTTSDDNADCELAWTNLDMPARLFAHLWRGVCRASEQGKVLHTTQKPVALMRWCLLRAKLAPGALVYDPYMGSGPIAKACKELGYRYIGVELVEQYCEAAALRLQQEVMEFV
jgi:site-specific DNA-methyltransferase (adenine-specific)